MAIYYVRPDGNDANTGLGSSSSLAWATISKALGATGISGGDTVYVAPGRYTSAIVIGGTYLSATYITGDPLCTQFSGVTAGKVLITNITSAGTAIHTGVLLSGSGKSNLNFSNLAFEANGNTSLNRCVDLLLGQNNSFTRCTFRQIAFGAPLISFTPPTSLALNAILDKCIFGGGQINYSGTAMVGLSGNNVADTTSVRNCIFHTGVLGSLLGLNAVGASIYNCTFINTPQGAIASSSGSLTFPTYVRNCLFSGCQTALNSSVTGHIVQEYNRFINSSNFQVATSVTSTTTGNSGIEDGYSLIVGLNTTAIHASEFASPNTSFGTSIGAPTTDIYGFPWSGTSPDAGASTYRLLASVNAAYNPTERNSSSITIAPGETSRSLYLYLGATGLTHTTTNLTASYTRNGQASVPINLVAQTPTGSYVSGGFCEVSAPYARGTYRLDVPNAAFDFGADDVTIFVGGANTTNGAVVTCNMQGIAGNIVHIGPFKVIGDGLGSDQPLDIVQGVQAPVSVQLVDANENGVDISGATVEAKVYNAIGSLIATYSCVPVYAADGRCTFQLTTSVTNTAGVYNVTLTRTIGGNIIVFGPMKMIVRAN